jgi:hypothetical protein
MSFPRILRSAMIVGAATLTLVMASSGFVNPHSPAAPTAIQVTGPNADTERLPPARPIVITNTGTQMLVMSCTPVATSDGHQRPVEICTLTIPSVSATDGTTGPDRRS